jgi:hypothetical protein
MTNRIENAYEGFTADVITLLTIGERRDQIRPLVGDAKDRAEFLRSALIDVLAPIMRPLPAFIQQVVARAIVDHVDWQTVAAVVATNPEEN